MRQLLLCALVCTAAVVAVSALPQERDYSSEEESREYQESEEESSDEYNLPLADDTPNPFEFVAGTFDQCMDHFDPKDPSENCTNTWKQRYWYSSYYYKKGSPLFINVGGESAQDESTYSGTWLVYAQDPDFTPALLVLEHRFYGNSYPIPPSNRTSAAMKIHTSYQALNDYAKLIKWIIKDKGLNDSKIVAFGGSYPGSLSAWMRQSYPELVTVAVASSAPLQYQLEYPEYIGVSSQAIKESNKPCYDKIKKTFTCMEALVNGKKCARGLTNVTSSSQLPAAVGKCGGFQYSVDTDENKSIFFKDIGRQVWADNKPASHAKSYCQTFLAQDSGDVLVDYGNFLRSIGVSGDCDYSATPLSSSRGRNKKSGRRNNRKYRRAVSSHMQKMPSPGDYDASDQLSFIWQVCNEFVNNQISDKTLGMLGTNTITTDILLYQCKNAYPDTTWTIDLFRKNVNALNKRYNGKNYNGTCTIFTNGSWDPWHVMGFTQPNETSNKNTVIFIPKGEHTSDSDGPAASLPETFARDAIADAQKKIVAQIKAYLKDASCSPKKMKNRKGRNSYL